MRARGHGAVGGPLRHVGPLLPVTGQLEGTRLGLTNLFCRFSATVSRRDARQVNGDAVCVYDDDRTEGTWRMSRVE